MGIPIGGTIVGELVGDTEIAKKVGQTVVFHFHVGRDAAAVTHRASCSGVEHFREGVGQMHGRTVFKFVGLNAAAARYVVFARCDFQHTAEGHGARFLHKALSVGALTDDNGAVVILQRAARDFGRRSTAVVDEHGDGDVEVEGALEVL